MWRPALILALVLGGCSGNHARSTPIASAAEVKAWERDNFDEEVLYLQFDRSAGEATREEKDIAHYVSQDRHRPSLAQLDLTERFNAWPDAVVGKREFKATMLEYLRSRPPDCRLAGFIFSGHSTGSLLLQEVVHDQGPHTYRAKLDLRAALLELRADPNDEVRRLVRTYFDQVEYVVALACFEGSATGEWSRIFPNATIVGTEDFAPSASREDSGTMVRAAITAATLIDDGGSAEEAIDLGMRAATDLLRNERGLRIDPPQRRRIRTEEGAKRAERIYLGRPDDPMSPRAQAQKLMARFLAYPPTLSQDARVTDLANQLKEEGLTAAEIRELYSIVNAHYLSRRSLWALDQPEGAAMQLPEEIVTLGEQCRLIFLLRKRVES